MQSHLTTFLEASPTSYILQNITVTLNCVIALKFVMYIRVHVAPFVL